MMIRQAPLTPLELVKIKILFILEQSPPRVVFCVQSYISTQLTNYNYINDNKTYYELI
jgi:hypothetical protein